MLCSSPTTTSAVKEKRRPPLTTLATRLISTTRSWRSRPAGDTERSTAIGSPVRLEAEATLARAVGERADMAVVLVAAPVEDDGVDAGGLGPLGEEPAGPAGALDPGEIAQLGLVPLDGGPRRAGGGRGDPGGGALLPGEARR